jgi:mannosyl-oligosaccharide alpha-1,2-mannosidase
MMRKSNLVVTVAATFTFFLLYHLYYASDVKLSLGLQEYWNGPDQVNWTRPPTKDDGRFHWHERTEDYPVTSFIPIPIGKVQKIPAIQHKFSIPPTEDHAIRRTRQRAVREEFKHAWNGYTQKAWLKDELAPVTGGSRNTFGGAYLKLN